MFDAINTEVEGGAHGGIYVVNPDMRAARDRGVYGIKHETEGFMRAKDARKQAVIYYNCYLQTCCMLQALQCGMPGRLGAWGTLNHVTLDACLPWTRACPGSVVHGVDDCSMDDCSVACCSQGPALLERFEFCNGHM